MKQEGKTPIDRGRPFLKSHMGFGLLGVLLVFIWLFFPSVHAEGAEYKNLILATTTSIQDAGLLDILIPAFEKKTGYFVKVIAVGSGQAMALGRRGQVDILLVHSPEEEKKFITDGFGVDRRLVMHNDYVVVGPPSDPAAVGKATSTRDCFRRIANTGALFVSRGDNSGTHSREKKLWKAAGIEPEGNRWYQQTGLGMGQTLGVAAEKKGYTLTDRATYISLKENLGLAVLNEGDTELLNIYSVITLNPDRFKKINVNGARSLADFLVAPETQRAIGGFGMRKYGAPLFIPNAGKKGESLRRP